MNDNNNGKVDNKEKLKALQLTIDKLKTGFSYIKESTSLNPEGLHHGH